METFVLPHMPASLREVHLALFPSLPEGHGAALRQRLIRAASLPSAPAPTSADGKEEEDEGERERAALNFAFLDAAVIVSRQHLLTAVVQALIACARGPASEGNAGGMRSNNIHGEVVAALFPGNNIGEALRVFGVGPTTTDLLLLRVSGETDAAQRTELYRQMCALASPSSPSPSSTPEGQKEKQQQQQKSLAHALPTASLDAARVRKVYKLNDAAALKPQSQPKAKAKAEQGGALKIAAEEQERESQATLEALVVTSVAMRTVAA